MAAIGIGGIWVAVLLLSLLAPDLVSGSQQHLPVAAFTAWFWAGRHLVLLWTMGRLRGNARWQPAWIGLSVMTLGIGAVATILAITLPVMVTGTDPTQIPFAPMFAPVAAAMLTAVAGVVGSVFRRGPGAVACRATSGGDRQLCPLRCRWWWWWWWWCGPRSVFGGCCLDGWCLAADTATGLRVSAATGTGRRAGGCWTGPPPPGHAGELAAEPVAELGAASSMGTVTKTRLEAFSDGVLAIAITLLVIEIRPPEIHDESLAHALWTLWPNYLAYLVSFLTIGVIWLNHHRIFERVVRVDGPLLVLNLNLLLWTALIPFPTAVVAEHLADGGEAARTASALYSGVLLVTSFAFAGLFAWITHDDRLLDRLPPPGVVRAARVRFMVGLVVYAVAFALSWVSALLTLVLCGLMALYYAFDQATVPAAVEPGDHQPTGRSA